MATSVPGNSCIPECVLKLDSKCVTYNGNTISPVGIIKFSNLNDVIQAIANAIIAIPPPVTTIAWGNITGTLSNQTDLQNALSLLAPLNSPSLTGNPTAPTQIIGDNSTKIATTAFVTAAVAAKTIAWGSITGTLSAQTDLQSALNLKANTSSLATVAFTGSYTDLINTPSIVNTFNTRSGAVTLSSADIVAALGFTPVPPTDVQIFSVAGTFTWTKPAGAKSVSVRLVASGGGGGSGRRGAANSASTGGGGGAGGGIGWMDFPASVLGATETVVVGAGGLGGAAITVDNTNGNSGGAGNPSSFGLWLTVYGGHLTAGLTGSNGGTTTSVGTSTGGAGFPNVANQTTGGIGAGATTGTVAQGVDNINAPAGGAGGGGITALNVAAPGQIGAGVGNASGAVGVIPGGYNNALPGGSAGTLGVGQNGGIGGSPGANQAMIGGSGGGGGASNLTAVAGNGGTGGFPGGGGGGGGSSRNGFNSGAGGTGGGGIVIVTTYF